MASMDGRLTRENARMIKTIKPVSKDSRYTVTLERLKDEKPRYVVRFSDEVLGHFGTYSGAVMLAVGDSARRRGCLVVEAVEG